VSKKSDHDARGRFKPGNQAGRKGKPVGSRHRTTRMLDAFGEDKAKDIVQTTISLAVDGHLDATALLLPYIWPRRKGGRVLPAIDLPPLRTATDVVKAHARIAAAVADGEITVEEGDGLGVIVDRASKAIDTAELMEVMRSEMQALRQELKEVKDAANRDPS
jgi:hypothetical protein